MHVFDFAEMPEYAAIARSGLGRIFAAGAFAHRLLDNGLLVEVTPPDVREGDIVVYFGDDGRFKHAGLSIANGRVLSKWGNTAFQLSEKSTVLGHRPGRRAKVARGLAVCSSSGKPNLF